MPDLIQAIRDAYELNPTEALEMMPKLFQAVDDGKIVELPSKSDETIRMVEIALQITLYDWQKTYIFGKSDYQAPGRATGKTLAHMIKLCLSDGEPINLFQQRDIEHYSDGWHGTRYLDWYRRNLWDVYEKLKRQPLRLRKIYFTRAGAEEAIRHPERRADFDA